MAIPVVFILRRFGWVKMDVSKSTGDVIPPGALTPNLSRAPIALTEEPMGGEDNPAMTN